MWMPDSQGFAALACLCRHVSSHRNLPWMSLHP
jgi:hypothetical protein